jgi:predicted double-glycine peptidase
MVPVPDVQQPDSYTCGVASFMAILSYYGVGTDDYDALAKALHATKKDGTDFREIVEYAHRVGLVAEARTGMTVEGLEDCLKAHQPVIVSIQAYEEDGTKIPKVYYRENENGHFVVAIGFDDDNFYFMDPSLTGRRGYLPKGEFKLRWHDNEGTRKHPNVLEHLGIVVYSQKEAPSYPHRAKRID